MVSLRRRRLLGLCSGLPNSVVAPCPMYFDNEGVAQFTPPPHRSTNPAGSAAYPKPWGEKKKQTRDMNSSLEPGSSNALVSSSSLKYESDHQLLVSGSSAASQELRTEVSPDPEVKRRKKHRRKRMHDPEQCVMRGVYFKNMKWQAAIKVDKKQIHLGTVGSQQEAARLYDRAAFVCGREPNFELAEEEKQELRKFKWEDFLAMTRLAISSKKIRRRRGFGSLLKPEPPQVPVNGSSHGEEAEEEQEESTS